MVDEPQSDDVVPDDIDEFFGESSGHSVVKTAIATKYFFTWAGIITLKMRSDRIGYVDVYAGPGRYVGGTKSTPMLVLERAIADPRLRETLVTYFNDAKPGHAASLAKAIAGLPGIKTLTHAPRVDTHKVGPQMVAALEKPLVPTFAFIDPYGYKGLSLGLVNAVIKDWACECLFFFNYNRINMGIDNPVVAHHMEALFGRDRLAGLRAAIADRASADREVLIMAAVTGALRELGGRYVLPFRFKMEESDRTSHYLIFVSKKFLGYEIMRDVMGKASSTFIQGVPSFEYNPGAAAAPSLFELTRPLDELIETLASKFMGRTLTVRQVFEADSPGKLLIIRNYKEALLTLEENGRAAMSPPADQRPRRKGKPTLADNVVVRFLQQPGQPVKIQASGSTPDRPAAARLPSASARPTA